MMDRTSTYDTCLSPACNRCNGMRPLGACVLVGAGALLSLSGADCGCQRSEQIARGRHVQGVTRLERDNFKTRIHTQQGEIADEVEHFMAHNLIGETQLPHVIVAVDDDGIIQRSAERQTLRVERFDLSTESESAIRRDLA